MFSASNLDLNFRPGLGRVHGQEFADLDCRHLLLRGNNTCKGGDGKGVGTTCNAPFPTQNRQRADEAGGSI